jgi:RNase P/RNase MRP subunit p30
MAQLLNLAGYCVVGLTVPTGLMRERVGVLKRIFREAKVETALRIDLSSTSRVDLLRLLRRFRNSYDIVAVRCTNARVATVACRDRRVDVIYFDPLNRSVRFTHPLANLLRGAVEFNLVSTLLKEPMAGTYTDLMKQCAIAREHNVSVATSSGSTQAEFVRTPLQMRALASAMGLTETQTLAGVSSTPLAIIERNLTHRSLNYIEEGVRVVLPKVH